MKKIVSWSDGHGYLPAIKDYVDLVIIAGDISPLFIQTDIIETFVWFKTDFIDFAKECNCDKVILVPGNHDFVFQQIKKETFDKVIEDAGLKDKLIILIDESYDYDGYKIYGTPWVCGSKYWAFSVNNPKSKYDNIPEDCDILITHQPPKVDKVGCSYPNLWKEKEFGYEGLTKILENRHIKYHFCGHIHTGVHGGVKFNDTTIYNVSLLNEDYNYNEKFDLTEVEL